MKTTPTLPVKFDKGAGEPLILLHGLGNNHTSWQYVLKHLDYTKWRVIALDLLGFGDAPKPKNTRYTPDVHADAVLATLDKLGIEKATFAGHSMGCIIAINLAVRFPKRAKQLVLLGAPLYEKKPVEKGLAKLLHPENAYFKIFDIVKSNPNAVQAGGEIADDLVPFIKGLEITEETWPAYASSLEYTITQYETFKQAKKLKVPTLFVNGLLDFFIIRPNIRAIAKANKQHIRINRTVGPHELTPRQGRTAAQCINLANAKMRRNK